MNSYVKMVWLVADTSFGIFNTIMLSTSVLGKKTGGCRRGWGCLVTVIKNGVCKILNETKCSI